MERTSIIVSVVVLLLVISIIGPELSDLTGLTGFASGNFNFANAFAEMGKKDKPCRPFGEACDAGLKCKKGVCREPSLADQANIKIPKVADITKTIKSTITKSTITTFGPLSGTVGGACRREQPFCNAGLDCVGTICKERPRGAMTEPPRYDFGKFSDALQMSNEARLAEEAKEEKKRRAACREQRRIFRVTGTSDRKCHSECFKFDIPDPDCCFERYCRFFKDTPDYNVSMLENQCATLDLFVSCPNLVPPPRQLCDAENPSELLEEGQSAFFYDFEGGRHIDVCLDQTTVKHMQCFNESVSEELTRCPENLRCEGGLCGGQEVAVCTDSDPEQDVYLFGDVRYLDYYPHPDQCSGNSYTRVDQYACFPQEEIQCWGWGCEYALYAPGFCRNSFCAGGVCKRPADYEIPLLEEFPRNSLTYQCTDTDADADHPDGRNPDVPGEATITVSYLGRVLDTIRSDRDGCTEENIDDETECYDAGIWETFCSRNELGQPIISGEFVRCAEGTMCDGARCVPVQEMMCTDSDGGDNRPVWGQVEVSTNQENVRNRYTDSCRSRGRCGEMLCIDDRACSRNYDAPRGTISNENPWDMDNARERFDIDADIPMYALCLDYDFGNHPTMDSYAQALEQEQIITHTDNCIDDDTIREMVCRDDHLGEEINECPFGCIRQEAPEDAEAPQEAGQQNWVGHRCAECRNDADCGEGYWCDQQKQECNGGERVMLRHRVDDDFENYPRYFLNNNIFSVQLVIADNAPAEDVLTATDIAASLTNWIAQTCPICQVAVVTRLASELADQNELNQNTIILGGLCENRAFRFIDNEVQEMCDADGGREFYDEFENNAFLQSEAGHNDAGDILILVLLIAEEPACRRNAGQMLADVDQHRDIFGDRDEVAIPCPE